MMGHKQKNGQCQHAKVKKAEKYEGKKVKYGIRTQ